MAKKYHPIVTKVKSMLEFTEAAFIKFNRLTVTLLSGRNGSPEVTGVVAVLRFRAEIRTRSGLMKNMAVLSVTCW